MPCVNRLTESYVTAGHTRVARILCDLSVSKLFEHGVRVVAACLLAFGFSGAASAQVLNCPVGSNLTVSGTVTNVASSCVVDSGVLVTIDSTGELDNFGPQPNNGILTNNGTINNGGTLQNEPNQTITNFGTVLNNNYLDIRGGTLTNAGTLDNFRTVTDTIALGGTLNNAGTLTNTGSMTLFDTLTNFAGAQFNNTGTLSLSGFFVEPFPGDNTFTNNGTLTNYASGVVLAAVVLTNGGSIINYGTFYTGGVGTQPPIFTNNGTITNYGTFSTDALEAFPPTVVNNGTITNYGTFSNVSSGTLTALVTNNGTFDNFGTLTNRAGFDNSATGNFINETGAIVTIEGGGLGNEGTLTNNGAITISGGELYNTGTLTNNGSITNKGGDIFLQGGTLTNSAGSTFVQTSGQTVVDGTMNSVPAVQIQGGTLTGLGTINGDVNNSGGVAEPGEGFGGRLTIDGDYSQSAPGELMVDLDDDSFYGVLDVSDLATLDGTVDFVAENGFTPVAGDDFTFLFFGSLSGEFAGLPEFTNWMCPTGDTCDLVYGANSVSLDILGSSGSGGATTPEPSTFALLGMAALLFRIVKYRRGSKIA